MIRHLLFAGPRRRTDGLQHPRPSHLSPRPTGTKPAASASTTAPHDGKLGDGGDDSHGAGLDELLAELRATRWFTVRVRLSLVVLASRATRVRRVVTRGCLAVTVTAVIAAGSLARQPTLFATGVGLLPLVLAPRGRCR